MLHLCFGCFPGEVLFTIMIAWMSLYLVALVFLLDYFNSFTLSLVCPTSCSNINSGLPYVAASGSIICVTCDILEQGKVLAPRLVPTFWHAGLYIPFSNERFITHQDQELGIWATFDKLASSQSKASAGWGLEGGCKHVAQHQE